MVMVRGHCVVPGMKLLPSTTRLAVRSIQNRPNMNHVTAPESGNMTRPARLRAWSRLLPRYRHRSDP
jgi:hypothetical protein